MQVPEKLALIGGSILLSSTLIFTLRSQASSIIPDVGHSIGNVYQDITNTNAEHGVVSFDDAFQNAQKQGWQTGTWGSAKFYVDNKDNMYVGSGNLQGSLYNALGSDTAHQVKVLNVQGNVRAPQDSSYLFSGAKDRYHDDNYSLTTINGMEHVDTSQVVDMTSMFANDHDLNHLDLSSWDTQNVESLFTIFNNTDSLNDLKGLNDWNTQKVWSTSWAFYKNPATHLDLSNWHMKLTDASDMFNHSGVQSLDISNVDDSTAKDTGMFAYNDNIQQIKVGNQFTFTQTELQDGTWHNGGQTLNTSGLTDGAHHPGTWLHQ